MAWTHRNIDLPIKWWASLFDWGPEPEALEVRRANMKRDKSYQLEREPRMDTSICILYNSEHGVRRTVSRILNVIRCLVDFLFRWGPRMQERGGAWKWNRHIVGIELFRAALSDNKFCHSFDKRRRRLGHETWGEVRLKSGAREDIPQPLSHDDETSPRTCLRQWGLSGIWMQTSF